jgi:energy-coupling factor transporter transmembrane protein EcfT
MIALGPNTHLLVLVVASILTVLVSDPVQANLLVVASVLYMLCNGLARKALYFILFYIASAAILSVLTDVFGTWKIIFYTLLRMIPIVMIGTVLLHSSPSSIMCAFERIAVPKVVFLEMKAIRDGIRARGIFPRWYSPLLHPAMAYECFFMPLIVRCLKLSSELASSAELRGIECEKGRTSIHPVQFQAADGLAVGLYTVAGAGIYWTGGLIL